MPGCGPVADRRAILVSLNDILPELPGERATLRLSAVARIIADARAAGDQPRIRWCAEHGRESPYCVTGIRDDDGVWHPNGTCRVVDAIVCVLEESTDA